MNGTYKEADMLRCRYLYTGREKGHGYRYEDVDVSEKRTAIICINLCGLLMDEAVPLREFLVGAYSGEEMSRRDTIVRTRILPILRSAREVGFPVVYAANGLPNVALRESAAGRILETHLLVRPEAYAEAVNDPNEYTTRSGNVLFAEETLSCKPDFVAKKWTYSAFYGTLLDRFLRNLRIENVLLCGFDTECDVLCTGLDSTAFGYKTVVIRDAVSSACRSQYTGDMTINDRWILHFEEAVGYSIQSEELLQHLDRRSTVGAV